MDCGELALGSMFPRAGEEAPRIPLHLMRCDGCDLVQLLHDTDPALMYRAGYGYKSGINENMVRHLHAIVADLVCHVQPGDSVLDIGCNDGTLLRHWMTLAPGIRCFGIDPIGEPIDGATVTRDYFRAHDARYKVITSIAMFYDLPDPVGFARDVAACLDDDGVWALEVGYAGAVHDGLWDGVCHEHLEYYGLRQIVTIAQNAGLAVISHRFTPANGGSLVVVLGKGRPEPYAADVIGRERQWDWSRLSHRVHCSADAITAAIYAFARVDVLGASTKGNTLLQVCGLTSRKIGRAVERNGDKVGRFTPGSRIPIVSEAACRADPPDALLVLPYHFKAGIMARESALRAAGTRFIFPLPEVTVC